MLRLTDIQLMVGEKRVLQNVSARIFRPGIVTGIIGPNGGGQGLALARRCGPGASGGEAVLWRGAILPMPALARQKHWLYAAISVCRMWPLCRARGCGTGLAAAPFRCASESEKRVDAALQRCAAWGGFRARRIDTLSGGEKARVYLARLLSD